MEFHEKKFDVLDRDIRAENDRAIEKMRHNFKKHQEDSTQA